MHSRRALLYMPGDNWKMITKSVTLGVDSICMDMEDGTAINKKDLARATIVKALLELDFGKSEKLARINSVGSGWEKDDIEIVLPYHPEGIVIPKVESFEQVEWAGSAHSSEAGFGCAIVIFCGEPAPHFAFDWASQV